MAVGVQDPHDRTVLVILCVLLTARLAWLARHPQTWRPALRRATERSARWVRASLRAGWDTVTSKPGSATPEDPLMREVNKLMTARCVLLANRMYSVADKCLQVLGVARLLNIATGTPSFITPGTDIILLVDLCCLFLLRVFPKVVRERTLDFWFSLWMLIHTASVTQFGVHGEALPMLSGFNLMFRFSTGLLTTNLPLVYFWNIVYLLAVSTSYSFQDKECTKLPSVSTVIVAETAICFYLCLFFNHLRAAHLFLIRQELEAREARCESSALTAILNTMSDAVVELDEELRIVGGSDQLSSMLLRGHVHGLEGMPFVHFAATEEDGRRFEDHLVHQPAQVQTRAGILHMRIRDGLSNCIDVEIFHVLKPHQDRSHHLVGVREFTDSDRPAGFPGVAEPRLQVQDTLSSHSSDWEDVSLEGGAAQGAEVKVVFDSFTYETSDMSSGFIELCGARPSHGKFDKWVVQKEGQNGGRLLLMLGHNVNELVNDMEPADCVTTLENVRFQVPISASAVTEFQAACSISLRLDTSSEDCVIATATFTGITGKRVRTKRGRGPRCAKAGGGSSHREGSNGPTASAGALARVSI